MPVQKSLETYWRLLVYIKITNKNAVSNSEQVLEAAPDKEAAGLCRVYSNSYCSCLFEPEIIKICQLSHKMYSNSIVNFQECTPILNAHTKKVWKLIICTTYILAKFCEVLIIRFIIIIIILFCVNSEMHCSVLLYCPLISFQFNIQLEE